MVQIAALPDDGQADLAEVIEHGAHGGDGGEEHSDLVTAEAEPAGQMAAARQAEEPTEQVPSGADARATAVVATAEVVTASAPLAAGTAEVGTAAEV